MHHKKQIAIIGGGIAGLTFARSLGNEMYELHIFEKKEAFGEVGAAISVFPNALCVMEALGLLPEVLANSGAMQKVYLKTDKGAILSRSEPRYEYPTVCIHRADLHRILLQNVPAQLYTHYALSDISHLENGQVALRFENGETRNFDAVIGADGIHSVVRQHIINDGKPIFRGYNVWRGVVATHFDIGYGSETHGNGKRVGIVPVKDGVYGWWATCNEDFMQSDEPEGSKNKLLRLFGDWHDPIPELMANTEHIIKNALADREPVRGWSKGQATLLGDAAHPTTPNLGQGGCMAMEGAYTLAKAIERYGLGPQAFQRYEDLHFPRAKRIVLESRRLGFVGQLSQPLLIALRNLAFRCTPSSLAMKLMSKYFEYRVTKLEV